MSGMAIKFTSLAQIEANQFVPADDRLYPQEAEDFGAGVPRLRRCHRRIRALGRMDSLCARRGRQRRHDPLSDLSA